jgi:hypothetical protein
VRNGFWREAWAARRQDNIGPEAIATESRRIGWTDFQQPTTTTKHCSALTMNSNITHSTSTRTGKIARLPLGIRQELNQRLADGEPQQRLVAWLNANTSSRSGWRISSMSGPSPNRT